MTVQQCQDYCSLYKEDECFGFNIREDTQPGRCELRMKKGLRKLPSKDLYGPVWTRGNATGPIVKSENSDAKKKEVNKCYKRELKSKHLISI